HDDGARANPLPLDVAVAEPAPGGLIAHAHLSCVVRELHVFSITGRHNSYQEKEPIRYIICARSSYCFLLAARAATPANKHDCRTMQSGCVSAHWLRSKPLPVIFLVSGCQRGCRPLQ